MIELYKKHRPKKLSQVIGQDIAVGTLETWLEDESTPHTILLTGPSGVGKTTIGRILCKELNCGKADYQELNTADARGVDKVREIIEKENLVENSAKVGKYFLERLNELAKSPHIDDVQGLGLFAGLEIVQDKSSKAPYDQGADEIKKFNEAVRERGLIVRASPKGRLQLAPPLIATTEDIDKIVDILELALKDSNLD